MIAATAQRYRNQQRSTRMFQRTQHQGGEAYPFRIPFSIL
jgi:hypothetical protein